MAVGHLLLVLLKSGHHACMQGCSSCMLKHSRLTIAGTKPTLIARIEMHKTEPGQASDELQEKTKGEEAADAVAKERYSKPLNALTLVELRGMLKLSGAASGKNLIIIWATLLKSTLNHYASCILTCGQQGASSPLIPSQKPWPCIDLATMDKVSHPWVEPRRLGWHTLTVHGV